MRETAHVCNQLFLALTDSVRVKVVLYKRCKFCPVFFALSTTLDKKKNHHRNSRREERCSTCDIMLDQAWSAQGKYDPRLSASFALRWSSMISHVKQLSSRRESRGWFFFFFFVQGSTTDEASHSWGETFGDQKRHRLVCAWETIGEGAMTLWRHAYVTPTGSVGIKLVAKRK